MSDKDSFENRIHTKHDVDHLHTEYRKELLSDKGKALMNGKDARTLYGEWSGSHAFTETYDTDGGWSEEGMVQFAEACAASLSSELAAVKGSLDLALNGSEHEAMRENISLRSEVKKLNDRLYVLSRERWSEVCKSEVFQELKHGQYRPVLQLLQNQQISVGKAAQAIAELAHGCTPNLPSDYEGWIDPGTVIDEALQQKEHVESQLETMRKALQAAKVFVDSTGPTGGHAMEVKQLVDNALQKK